MNKIGDSRFKIRTETAFVFAKKSFHKRKSAFCTQYFALHF